MVASGNDPQESIEAVSAGLNRSFHADHGALAFSGGTWLWDEPQSDTRRLVPEMLWLANCMGPNGEETAPQEQFLFFLARLLTPQKQSLVHQLPQHLQGEEWTRLLAQVDYLATDGGDNPEQIADALVAAARKVADTEDGVSHSLMVNSLPRAILETAAKEDQPVEIPYFASRPTPDALCFSLYPADDEEPRVVSPRIIGPGNWRLKNLEQVDGPQPGETRFRFEFMRGRGPMTIPTLQVTLPDPPEQQTPRRLPEQEKTGRNDPCWCGSGRKFKKCHGERTWCPRVSGLFPAKRVVRHAINHGEVGAF